MRSLITNPNRVRTRSVLAMTFCNDFYRFDEWWRLIRCGTFVVYSDLKSKLVYLSLLNGSFIHSNSLTTYTLERLWRNVSNSHLSLRESNPLFQWRAKVGADFSTFVSKWPRTVHQTSLSDIGISRMKSALINLPRGDDNTFGTKKPIQTHQCRSLSSLQLEDGARIELLVYSLALCVTKTD